MLNHRIRDDADSTHSEASHFCNLITSIPRAGSAGTDQNNVGDRRAERISWKLPVNLGVATGTTRDISASGVFFETAATCPLLSNVVRFELELDTPNGKVLLKCLGEIVRIEPRDKRVGVAARIIESSAKPVWLA